MNILGIENLNASFSGKQVLCDISLTAQAGRRLALVGESGSGRTVLARGIVRLNPLVSFEGHLRSDDNDLLTQSERALQKLCRWEIGMVFQEPMTTLNPAMRVDTRIAEVLTLHPSLDKKQAWAGAVELLAETDIREPEQKALTYPFRFSGEQRQRTMITVTVTAEPKLLIADELITALDVAVQAQILDLLARLQQAHNMVMLYIIHDPNLVRRFADDVIVMHDGRIIETGAAAEVFTRPQHEYTQMLLNTGAARKVVPLTGNPATVLQAGQLSVVAKEAANWFKKRSKTLPEPVSFNLRAGETLGIIGESSYGKTTLAKAMIHPIDTGGHLRINGEDWKRGSRHDIQMIFQGPFGALNPHMNVFNIVSEALRAHEPDLSCVEMRQHTQDVSQRVGLPKDALEHYPHTFSGGQRWWLAIARVAIVRPRVPALNKPTSALDVRWQQQILELFTDLQKKHGLNLIIISHNLAVIHVLSHRVMVLKDDKVVEEGSYGTVLADPSSNYTRHLMSFRAD